jgi:hypothetical protein
VAHTKVFTEDRAKDIGKQSGIDWNKTNFNEICPGLEIG